MASGLTLAGCTRALELAESDAPSVLAQQTLDAEHPGRPGPLAVRTLFYGSGTDKNRPEYRDSVAFRTESVDASKLVRLGDSAHERNDYWGFTPEEFPLNARVWYPDGPGPYPLVLVVHGNHNMKDFSDPGYDYLGELLASRGFILASVDMNFINGGIRGENDGRGWLLLKHLQAWSGFNQDEGNPFHGMVDMGNLAVMGHSRGGEAVGHAAAFNRLSHYPDDASLTFDFGFDLKAVVAIAPVDGQYLPTDRPVPVENVNYLVFHGSHDGDVSSFHGLRQYQRVRFTDGNPWFKSAVYVYRANHGQWNTVWGNHDNGPRSGRILDLRGLLDPEEQREFGRIYISAFLEATLKGKSEYLPIFRDHRVIGEWLPKTMYITRYREQSYRALADFEGDIDLTTGTAPGVALRGDSLSVWRERTLLLRSRNRSNTSASQHNQAAWLGWNNEVEGQEAPGPAAQFTVSFPSYLSSEWGLGESSTLELLLMGTECIPGPRKAPSTEENQAGDESGAGGDSHGESGEGCDADPDEDTEPVDLSIMVMDLDGIEAAVPLSHYGPVRRPLEMHILRRRDREDARFESLSELVMQGYSIPLSDFTAASPGLDLGRLTEVRLVFDRVSKGEVVVDDIGFANPDPAFLGAPLGGF